MVAGRSGPLPTLERAWELYRAGDLSGAEAVARTIVQRAVLGQQAALGEAAHLIGVILAQTGRTEEAVSFMARAADADPGRASCHSNLCEMSRQTGDRAGAVAAGRAAVVADPAYAAGHNNLGIALFETGALEEALACYSRAIGLRPTFAEAHNNRRNALRAEGLPSEAIAAFRAALAQRGHYPEAETGEAERIPLHYALGKAYGDLGRHAEAMDQFIAGARLKRAADL
ncbi:tetratricopeptide repeat protein [Xanthobacter aminoxidans]|uniref:tetratricopeptide repeat protein n=1 Tax=Xanthobacter aminoxidans TaxID=186280 RepID=UPI00372CAA0C